MRIPRALSTNKTKHNANKAVDSLDGSIRGKFQPLIEPVEWTWTWKKCIANNAAAWMRDKFQLKPLKLTFGATQKKCTRYRILEERNASFTKICSMNSLKLTRLRFLRGVLLKELLAPNGDVKTIFLIAERK